jgi:tetrahydromethanopterin S-methyltransferase subunit F
MTNEEHVEHIDTRVDDIAADVHLIAEDEKKNRKHTTAEVIGEVAGGAGIAAFLLDLVHTIWG